MDLFLSVADDIKLEVFEVGPPLPPSAMTAKEMMEALDDRFEEFKFEEYHHVFCHFLNLHIDQFTNLEDFNMEFTATLEDLLDHGYPLDHIQACSAYFSKLRCTQNPWVAKKLKEWDSLSKSPSLEDLMKECPPWMIIRPLAAKPRSQTSKPESYTEDVMGPPSIKEEEGESSETEKSEVSSTSSHTHSRDPSTQSITVGASVEDLTDITAFPMPTQKVPKAPKTQAKRLSIKSDISKMSLPPAINRPLPPIPADTASTRSSSPPGSLHSASKSETSIKLQAPTSHPQQDLSNVHPALRPTTPAAPSTSNSTPSLAPPSTPTMTTPIRPSSSHSPPTLQPPFTTPEIKKRPQSSRGSPSKQASMETVSTWPPMRVSPARSDSSGSSILSLPLQGATIPEYRDTLMSGSGANPEFLGPGMESSTTLVGSHLSSSPPKSLMSRLSAELNDDDRKTRKSRSWSIKARLSGRRYEVKEII